MSCVRATKEVEAVFFAQELCVENFLFHPVFVYLLESYMMATEECLFIIMFTTHTHKITKDA